jgi:predicted nuclease of predicted toxin-antitoxin system
MLRLFMDENIPTVVAKVLREQGFDVVRPQEIGLQGADDKTQLQWATEHGYVVFTFDKGTMVQTVRRWVSQGLEHGGVIVCEQMPKDAVSVIVRWLKNVAQVHTNETLRNVTLHLGAVWDKPVN